VERAEFSGVYVKDELLISFLEVCRNDQLLALTLSRRDENQELLFPGYIHTNWFGWPHPLKSSFFKEHFMSVIRLR
jgi:hypothetical protein